jgi:putative nucleotidyltransferase with HDIG domain
MAKIQVDDIINKIEHLPTLPVVSKRIKKLLKKDEITIRNLEDLIEKEAPLASKILKIANSSFYGLINKTSSPEHALEILGLKEVKNIVLAFSIQNYFTKAKNNPDNERFWKHSIVCSQIAKFLGNHFNVPGKDTLFLSGLIHDIGKLIFDQYFHDKFLETVNMAVSKQIKFSEAEKNVLGVTHYQVAAKLLQQWQFPKEVIMQVFYHHAPWYDLNYTSGSIIIYLSDVMSKISGYTCIENEQKTEIDALINSKVFDFLIKNGFDLNKKTLEKLLDRTNDLITNETNNVLKIFD